MKWALRFRRLVLEVMRDPDMDKDAKLLAIAIMVEHDANRTITAAEKLSRAANWWDRINAMIGDDHFVQRAIHHDVPRYELPLGTVRCGEAMIRRDGLCGKLVHASVTWRDPLTGEAERREYCTRHWSKDLEDEARRNLLEWQANGSPTPGPNRGGALKRHLKAASWSELYRWAAPFERVADDPKPAVPKRPELRVIAGGEP